MIVPAQLPVATLNTTLPPVAHNVVLSALIVNAIVEGVMLTVIAFTEAGLEQPSFVQRALYDPDTVTGDVTTEPAAFNHSAVLPAAHVTVGKVALPQPAIVAAVTSGAFGVDLIVTTAIGFWQLV